MLKNDFEKEYTILCIYNGGAQFYLQNYKTIQEAKNKILEMVELEETRNRAYYVDNDFFENKYPLGLQRQKYFCIQEREITKWIKFKENQKHATYQDNLIMFRKRG